LARNPSVPKLYPKGRAAEVKDCKTHPSSRFGDTRPGPEPVLKFREKESPLPSRSPIHRVGGKSALSGKPLYRRRVKAQELSCGPCVDKQFEIRLCICPDAVAKRSNCTGGTGIVMMSRLSMWTRWVWNDNRV